MAGKKIPHNEEAEKKVLGYAMLDPEIIVPQMQVRLKPNYFYSKKYQHLYKAIIKTYKKHETVEPTLIREQLDGQLSVFGGISGLLSISGSVTTATEFDHFADLLVDCATRRKTLKMAWELADMARDKDQDSNSIVTEMNRAINEIASEGMSADVDGSSLVKAFDESSKKMEDGRRRWEGISWGFDKLDSKFGGLQKGTLSFISGPTSIGKSLLVCNLMHKQVNQGCCPAYISIELPEEQIAQRLLQIETGLCKRDLYAGTGEDFMIRAKGMIEAYPWRFLFNVSDLDKIALQIMRWAITNAVDIVYLDYMQVITTGKRFHDRLDRYSQIITTVKNLCTQFDLPIFFLSQVSRQAQREGKYDIHSIKYIGDAENEADKVFLLKPDKNTKRGSSSVDVELEKGKDNQAGLASVDLRFEYKTQKIEVL